MQNGIGPNKTLEELLSGMPCRIGGAFALKEKSINDAWGFAKKSRTGRDSCKMCFSGVQID
jgi:hypothetical protein